MAIDVTVRNLSYFKLSLHYHLISYFLYTDIDECSEGTDHCSQNCQNTIGSYRCFCNTGYRLNTDGVTCNGQYMLSTSDQICCMLTTLSATGYLFRY